VRIRLDQRADEAEPAASGSVAITLGERGAGDGLEVVVVHVAAASEAERAGVREQDVIESVDGVRPRAMRDARARLSGPAGSDVVVGVRRGAEQLKLRVGREAVRR
jgi:C-terminal processing protease CtpA/Prc